MSFKLVVQWGREVIGLKAEGTPRAGPSREEDLLTQLPDFPLAVVPADLGQMVNHSLKSVKEQSCLNSSPLKI